ncbi:hypothetical protein [Dickeya dadantii]|uniref:hypothetical protein n=1 Tax=Dickeya dadantii TaxID=204038 RepID=UPI0012683405|nr:hypothetical protein [Dickeya dadantii]
MPNCIINGCNNIANINFGVRLRRPDGSAIWAPNTEAYICNQHASAGFDVRVQLSTRVDNYIFTSVSANGGTSVENITPKRHNP